VTAAELIARMLAEYASVPWYADRGTAIGYLGLYRTAFKTSFVRARRLRFEYGDEQVPKVIWSDGLHTYEHWPAARRVSRPVLIDYGADIRMALGAVTGVSGGTSRTVPSMLLPVSLGGGPLGNLGEPRLDGDEDIAGHRCARVDGREPGGEHATLWIDRASYLLRRMITSRGTRFETTLSYDPSLARIEVGSIERPGVGNTPRPLASIPSKGFRVDDSKRIVWIRPDSPTARSGLAIGDEIEAVDGHAMDRRQDFELMVRHVKVGEQVALTIRRGGNKLEVVVPIEGTPSRTKTAPARPLVE
jgi:hypothetical protein